MKKTILALAVPAAFLMVNAAHASVSLYNQDGVSVDVTGAAEIQYIQEYNHRYSVEAGQDAYIRIDDADLAFLANVQVTENLKALAGIGFKFETSAEMTNDPTASAAMNDEVYVGLGGNFGTLTIGRQYLLGDDMGNAKDIELGTIQIGSESHGDQAIKWVFDNGQFYAGADIDLDQETSTQFDGRSVYGLRLGARPMPGLDMRVYYQMADNVGSTTTAVPAKVGLDVSTYNVEVDYTIKQFELAASYGSQETKTNSTGAKSTANFWQISGSMKLDEKTTVALGFDMGDDYEDSAGELLEGTSVYANVVHTLHPNATIYAELGTSEEKVKIDGTKKDSDFGYLIGMEVKF